MNFDLPNKSIRGKLLWGIGTVLALLVWTGWWRWQSPYIPSLPIFLLGLALLIIGSAAVRLGVGAFKRGLRWLFSRDALRLCAWMAAFLVTVVSLFYAVELWRGKRAWASVVREAHARGQSLEFDAVIPPQPPDGQNFAKAPFFAPLWESTSVAGNATGQSAEAKQLAEIERFKPAFHRQQDLFAPWLTQDEAELRKWFEIHFQDKTIAGMEEVQCAETVLAELGQYAAVLDELRAYSDRPDCWFPLDRQKPWPAFTRFGDALRGLMRLLDRQASAKLTLKHNDEAFRDVQLLLRLADYGRQKPQATSIAFAFHHLSVVDGLQPVWQGLAEHRWTAEQVEALQRQLQRLDLLADYPDAVRMDAVTLATFIDSTIPATRSTRSYQPRDAGDRRNLNLVRWVYPVGWSLADQAAIHQFHWQTAAPYVDVAARRIPAGRHSGARALFASSDPFFAMLVIPRALQMCDDASESFPLAQTAVDLATVACGLERHRLATGQYPETLNRLVPDYLDRLPHDIFSGEALKYRRAADGGFVLYSVGFNRTDDGGKPCVRRRDREGRPETRFDLDANDWVWTYPPKTGG